MDIRPSTLVIQVLHWQPAMFLLIAHDNREIGSRSVSGVSSLGDIIKTTGTGWHGAM